MKKLIIISILIVFSYGISAQVGINTDGSSADPSAMLDVKSDESGVLIPRLTLTERGNITTPVEGLLIYQTDNTPGFYYYIGSSWFRIGGAYSKLTDGTILIGDGTNIAQEVNMSGDAGISNTGVLTISPAAVNSSKISNNTIIDTDIHSDAGIDASKISTGDVENAEFDQLNGLSGNIQGQLNDEALTRHLADSTLQAELDTTQVGTGLDADGKYIPNGSSNYISTAASLKEADDLLDGQVKANSDKFGTEGTVEASKAVVVDASRNISNFNNLQADGTITSGNSIIIDGTGASYGTITESHGKISLEDDTLVTTGKIGVGTTSPHQTAALEVSSTSSGLLLPRMTLSQIENISSPADGLIVYNTDNCTFYFYSDCQGYWRQIELGSGAIGVAGTFVCGSIFVDSRDGGIYNTVLIGSQCWMAENLNYGDQVNSSISPTDNGTVEKYCYDNIASNCDVFGGLYQWDEVMEYVSTPGTQGICPTGWHIPTDAEWCTLEQFLDASIACSTTGYRGIDGGGQMKETGTTYWVSPNTGATNSSGFSGRGTGAANPGFNGIRIHTDMWSSDESGSNAWVTGLYYSNANVNRWEPPKTNSYSVRCLKDD